MKAPKCPICGGPWHASCPSKIVDPMSWRLLCAGMQLLLIVTALVIGPAVLG